MRLVPPPQTPEGQEKRERWDILLSAIFLSLGVTGLLLLQNPALWMRLIGGNTQRNIVGHVDRQEGSVRQRPQKSLIWRDTLDGQNNSVSAGDSIFTGPDGSAKLIMDSGLVLTILPNSLVIVPSINSKSLSVVEGAVQLDQTTSQQLALDVKGNLYQLKAGETAVIGAGGASVSKNSARPALKLAPPPLLSPADGARIALEKNQAAQHVVFNWKNLYPNLQTTVEIRDRVTRRAVSRQSSSTEGLSGSLAAGQYEWRAQSKSASGAVSAPSDWWSFSISKDQQTKLAEEADQRAEQESKEAAARQRAAQDAAQRQAAAQKAAQEQAEAEARQRAIQDAAQRQAAAQRAAQAQAAQQKAAQDEALRRATIQRNPAQEVPNNGLDPLLFP